jgi:hypothetical protein
MMTAERCRGSRNLLSVGFMLILGGVFSPLFAQSAGPELPVVVSASVPLYPRTALLAHIQGVVKIEVTTDGAKVSSVHVETGPPMLAQAAEDNIRTWRFEEHKPATFVVTFRYTIEEPPECDFGNATVLLHMPSEVQVHAKGWHTCDPAEAQHRPTTVHITVIHNGHRRPAPAEITASFAGRSLRMPVRDNKFEAPPDLVAAQSVTVETDVGGSHIRLTNITGADFAGSWTLRLAEHANDDYYDWPGPKGANIAASCMLELDNGHEDPARVLSEEHCRSKKK